MSKNPRRPAVAFSEGGWFDETYKSLSQPLFKFIAKRLRKDQTAVEEIFEETVVAGWKSYKTFRHKSSYFTWLCRIALNKIADYYHDQVNESSRFIVPLIDSLTYIDRGNLSPEENLALKELRASVNNCLNLLPYERRQLLWFRYWKDYSYEQIGKIMGISERAVEGRLYRAKEEFASAWSAKNK
jgi:RNA polymerase sigma factor (sigma-70 family)